MRAAQGLCFLPVEAEHAMAVAELPAHHHDPFDRILVAQALAEPVRLMTHDPGMARYSDTIIATKPWIFRGLESLSTPPRTVGRY